MSQYRVYCYRQRANGEWTEDMRTMTVDAHHEHLAVEEANRRLLGTCWHAVMAISTDADDEPNDDIDALRMT